MTSGDHNLIPSERGELVRGGDETHPILSELVRDLVARAKEKDERVPRKAKVDLAKFKAGAFMERLRRGDNEAWREAFRILFPMAHRSALRVLPNWEDAEDVAMKTLAEVSKSGFLDKRCKTFDDLKNLTRTIAKRRAIDEIRRKMAEKR